MSDPLLAWVFLRQRRNPRSASGWGAWRRRITMFMQLQKAFLVIPDCFEAIFVIFDLFNVLFVLF